MKSEKEIGEFMKVLMQIQEVLGGFIELSKKKPNDCVNKFKLDLVNTLLSAANPIINKQNKPFEGFELFNEDDIPTNSDVVLILTQYVACLKKFGREQTSKDSDSYNDYWIINGERSEIRADYDSLKK